jgi:probable F420-dependent oxidoreductase
MKVGVLLPNLGGFPSPESVEPFARRMEELGYRALFAGDHVALPIVPETPYVGGSTGVAEFTSEHDIYESVTLLSFLAAVTRRVQLGIAVQVVPYRNPLLNAKQLATLDALCGGRVVFGVGTGWCREEFEALGAVFERRGRVTDEQIEIFKAVCSGEEISFEGRHYRIRGTKTLPRPARRPHPPIWIGGISAAARRRAALLADGWYPIRLTPEETAAGVRELLELRRDHGLATEGYEVCFGIPVHFGDEPLPPNYRVAIQGSPEQMVEQVQAFAGAGVTQLTIRSSATDFARTADDMERFAAEVLPQL